MSKFFLLIILLSLSYLHLFSQEKKGNKDVEVIHFGNQETNKIENQSTHNNIIKFAPLSFLNGRFLVEYEHRINEYLSIQGGGGPNFRLLNLNFARLIDDSYGKTTSSTNNWNQDIEDDYYDFDIRKQTLGFMLLACPKFYFNSDALDGSYFAPVIRYERTNYLVKDIEPNSTSLIRTNEYSFHENTRTIDLIARYGIQTVYPKFTSEYFFGIGISLKNSLRQDVGVDENGIYHVAEENVKENLIQIELGLRLGLRL